MKESKIEALKAGDLEFKTPERSHMSFALGESHVDKNYLSVGDHPTMMEPIGTLN